MKPQREREDEGATHDLARYLGRSPVAFAVTSGKAHEIRHANDAFVRLLAAGHFVMKHDEPRAEATRAALGPLLDRVYASGVAIYDELLPHADDATERWCCTIWPVTPTASEGRGLMMEVRDAAGAEGARGRQRALTSRLLLGALRNEDAARNAVESTRLARFVASATRSLAMSLDEEATRAIMQRTTLPRDGTWCIVDIIEPSGAIHRLAVIHPDPAKQELARTLASIWHPGADDDFGVPRIMRAKGQPVVVTEDTAAALLEAANGPHNLAIIRELGFGSLLVTPLIARARVLGAITFVSPPGDTLFTEEEIAVASDLADRCAMALENARLYRETDALRVAADIANGAKSAFLGNMSHELRTPLNAIGGYADILDLGLHGPVTPEQQADLARIKLNQQHLLRLIAEILNFVSAQGRYADFPLTPVRIRTSIDDVAELLTGSLRDRGLELDRWSCDPDAMVIGDRDRIRQILINLVANAVKYTQAGGGRITISCKVMRDVVQISVADCGPGIPPEKMEEIFEPFTQLMSGLTDRQGGVGLGLAISRELARAMRGDLTVESILGEGSRFMLSLPRAIAAETAV